MGFKLVLEKILSAFEKQDIHYALMGGFALGIWGVGRATVDIDFLVIKDDIEKVDAIMQLLGYECKYRSENVSQYISPLKVLGEVDFLHAFHEASLNMLERAVEKEIFGGSLKIKVLKPEDLIGLKVQFIKNNPARENMDMTDIESLLSIHKNNIDWSLMKKYFKIFDMIGQYNNLYKKYKA